MDEARRIAVNIAKLPQRRRVGRDRRRLILRDTVGVGLRRRPFLGGSTTLRKVESNCADRLCLVCGLISLPRNRWGTGIGEAPAPPASVLSGFTGSPPPQRKSPAVLSEPINICCGLCPCCSVGAGAIQPYSQLCNRPSSSLFLGKDSAAGWMPTDNANRHPRPTADAGRPAVGLSIRPQTNNFTGLSFMALSPVSNPRATHGITGFHLIFLCG